MTIVEMTLTLSQEADPVGPFHEQLMSIELEAEDGDPYASIKTDRWSVATREEWIRIWDQHIGPRLNEFGK